MSAPFMALTMPANGGLPDRPIFINAARVQSVSQRFTRKAGHTGPATADSYDETGSWVCFGTIEDGDIQVVESYGEVTGAIRDAYK
jgi:hypothetical protein